jgi:hypothetical protein
VPEDAAAVIFVHVTDSDWDGEDAGSEKGSCNEGGCETHFEVVDGLMEENCQREFLRK